MQANYSIMCGHFYTGFVAENNYKVPKFDVGDHVRISKYKSILA